MEGREEGKGVGERGGGKGKRKRRGKRKKTKNPSRLNLYFSLPSLPPSYNCTLQTFELNWPLEAPLLVLAALQ